MRTQRDDAYSPAEAALLARLESLSAEVAATPDEDFRAATRTRLVAMAAVRTPATGATRRPPVRAGRWRRLLAAPAPRRRTRLAAGLAGATLTVTALGGLLGAAQGARPGDLLYDLKRGGEQTELALAGDSRRGLTLLGFASTRLDELDQLVGLQPDAEAVIGVTPSGGETGLAAGPDLGLVLDTVQTMDRQTTEGTAALTARAVADADAGALEVLSDWSAEQRSGLRLLADAVPTGAQSALYASRSLVDAVAARGAALEVALSCPGGASTAGADELGPLPAVCPEAPPAGAGTSSSSAAGPSPSGSAGTSGTAGAPVQSGASTIGGGTATGTAVLGPTTGDGLPEAPATAVPGGAAPTAAPSGAATSGGLPLPSLPVPSLPVPSLPVPSLPVPSLPVPSLPEPSHPRPSLPLPSVPGAPSAPAATAPSRPLIDLPLPVCLDLLGHPVVC